MAAAPAGPPIRGPHRAAVAIDDAGDDGQAEPGVTDAVWRTPTQRRGEAAVRNRVDELVDRFTLDDLREVRTGELSTGQRRIVDLAALLAGSPATVLDDDRVIASYLGR